MLLRRFIGYQPAAFFAVFTNRNTADRNKLELPPTKEPETGWDRVKAMYSSNDVGEASLEVRHVLQSSFAGCFIGACYGGFIKSRLAYLNFIESNHATAFKSTLDAKKKLQDYVTVAFARGAYTYGWKIGMFTFLFSITSTTISAYKGNTSLIEYTVGGALAGALYKANLGLAATFVGAGLGAFLSTIAGGIIIGMLKITGLTTQDLNKAMSKMQEARAKQYHEAVEKASEIKNDNLTKHHDEVLEGRGKISLAEIDK